MNPLLMDAVVAARQDELRRSARHSGSGRRGSPTRAVPRTAATTGTPRSTAACASEPEER
jgi:hypothetical protein